MNYTPVTVNVIVDAKIFRQFFMFENFSRKRVFASPVIFACLMSAFACICFISDAALLGGVLLFIGLGLSSFHIWKYFNVVKMQIKAYGLEIPKTVYSLHFTDEPDGIEVTNHGGGNEPLRYEWNSLYNVYRLDGCIYLYVLPEKAFLLPDGQSEEGTDALWQIISGMLPPEKLHDRRKKK